MLCFFSLYLVVFQMRAAQQTAKPLEPHVGCRAERVALLNTVHTSYMQRPALQAKGQEPGSTRPH